MPRRFPLVWLVMLLLTGCSKTTAVSQSPLAVCAPISTFADGKVPRFTRHVTSDGSDAAGDGSTARPFRTLTRAAQDAAPGTAIYLHAGTYSGGVLLSQLRGTAAAPIWIAGAPGEARPTIRDGGDALHFIKPRYLVIQDLEIVGSGGNGINIDDGDEVGDADAARFVVVQRVSIHDAGRRPSGIADCLKMAGVSDVAVLRSTFGRCGDGPGSGAVGVGGVGVHRVTIASNRFEANGYGAVQVKGGSDEVGIFGNVIQDAGWRGVNMGGSTGPRFFRPPLASGRPNYEAAHVRTRANVIIGGEAAAAFTGCVDCAFSHNTVVDPSKWVVRVLQETVSLGSYAFAPASGGVIADNIFYFRRSDVNTGEDINIGAGTAPASFSVARNLWYAHDVPRQSEPRLGAVGAHTGSIVGVDPQFADAARGDFHLRRTSAAVAAGDARFSPPTDVEGKCYTTPPSLGAFR
jgi:uncharacterized protein DUF1565